MSSLRVVLAGSGDLPRLQTLLRQLKIQPLGEDSEVKLCPDEPDQYRTLLYQDRKQFSLHQFSNFVIAHLKDGLVRGSA